MAAGFTVARADLPRFIAFLSEHVRTQMASGPVDAVQWIDGAIDIAAATPDLIDTLARMEPFGAANEEPRFVIPSVRLGRVETVGAGHVRAHAYGRAGGRLKTRNNFV